MNHVLRLLPAMAACVLLAACAAPGGTRKAGSAATGTDSQSILKQRAEQRWDFLIKHQADKAWTYLTPGYRTTVTQQKYADEMNHRPIQWNKATVDKVDCTTPDNCIVYVYVDYKINLPRVGNGSAFAPLKEQWLKLAGQWYYLPREAGANTLKAAH